MTAHPAPIAEPTAAGLAATGRSPAPDSPPSAGRFARRLPPGSLHPLLLVAIVGAGVVLRAYVLQSPIGAMDADEATSSLVSRQVLDGTYPAFIRPLQHGGTLLAYLRAPVLALFGPSPVVMKLVEVAVYAFACVLTWRLGRRIFSERAAQLGAGVMWVYSAASVWESTKVMLYYAPAVCIAVSTMLVCARLSQRTAPPASVEAPVQRDAAPAGGPAVVAERCGIGDPVVRRDVGIIGFLLGLALWTHPIALYVAVPACGWLAWRRPGLLRHVWLLVPTGILGGLPWLVHNLRNGWGSLEQPPGPESSTYATRLFGFFESLFPRLIGVRHQYFGDWYLWPLSAIVYGAVLVVALVAVRRWSGERTLLLTVALAYPFVFSVPRNSVFVGEPRYGMALFPVLALIAGHGISRVLRREVLAVGVVGLLSIISLASLRHVVVDTAGQPLDVLRPVATDELWPVLREQRIDAAYAHYWIGMRLQFEQREPFRMLPVNSYYLDYRDTAPAEGSEWAIFPKDSPLIDRWTALVTEQGLTFDLTATEHFVLVHAAAPVPFAVTLGVLDR